MRRPAVCENISTMTSPDQAIPDDTGEDSESAMASASVTTTQSGAPAHAQPPGISVLRNAVAILRTFNADTPVLGVTEIAERVRLHKSTVSRILATLEADNIVEQDPLSRRFRLGLGLIGLAGPLIADLDVRRAASSVLQQTSERTNETTALMMWDGSETVCVDQVASPQQVKHSTPLGTRYGTVFSSSVQVFLAGLAEAQVSVLLARESLSSPGMAAADIQAWLERLSQVRERGYAVNYGETSAQEVGVSAPVFDHRGETIAAILTSAPRFRVSSDELHILGTATAEAANRVTARLGGAAPWSAHDGTDPH